MNVIDIEKSLEELPEKVSKALEYWRIKTLDREKIEALLYTRFKIENDGASATEIKAMINASADRYTAVLEEIRAEASYQLLYEKLLCSKRAASLRTAF